LIVKLAWGRLSDFIWKFTTLSFDNVTFTWANTVCL
jgi:hypothetical protein